MTAVTPADAGVEWRSIETAPDQDMPVIYFFAKMTFRMAETGELCSFGEVRDHVERCGLGFWSRGIWSDAGTGHDMFEDSDNAEWLPTHWMPLPAPPVSP